MAVAYGPYRRGIEHFEAPKQGWIVITTSRRK
jgi:hypothetical protein